MDWWCSATRKTWTWTPRPYVGAWVIVASVIGLAVWWLAKGRHASDDLSENSSRTSRTVALVFGVLFLWAVLDWPLATLGAGYLATAQMARQIIMVMLIAPLLLFAIPASLAVRAVGWGRRLTVLRAFSRPIVAVPVAAFILLVFNTPVLVDPLLKTEYGAFAMDFAWIAAGFTLWLPVQCPHPDVRRLEGPAAMVYLIGQSIVPILPGFFMTWSDFPIYSTYEFAPRVFAGFDALTDQNAAAATLQVGGMFLLWSQIAYRFLKWGHEQMEESLPARQTIARTPPPAS